MYDYETIKQRYKDKYITEVQLLRFAKVGVITLTQARQIIKEVAEDGNK